MNCMTLVRPFSFVKREKYNQILPEKLINQMKIKKTNQTEEKITLVFAFAGICRKSFFYFIIIIFYLFIYFFLKNGDITIRDEICRNRKLQVTRGTTLCQGTACATYTSAAHYYVFMYMYTYTKKKFHSFLITFTSWVFLLSFTEIKFKVHV